VGNVPEIVDININFTNMAGTGADIAAPMMQTMGRL
jgi:hypothetical protein